MIAILGGLGAALFFTAATLSSSRGTRLIGAPSLLAGVMLVGLAITFPLVGVSGIPSGLGGSELAWLAVAGWGNVAGLLCAYAALRTGKVGIVAPVISTEGAIAAVIALAAGEQVSVTSGAMLAVIAGGILLAGMARDDEHKASETRTGRAFVLSVAAAGCFGASLYATGRVSAHLPIPWALLPARLVGVAAVALPLLLTARFQMTRRALPFVLISGCCEVGGFALFAVGARHSIAVSAVLASQFAGLSAVAAFFLFHERLSRVQLAGVTAIVAGVAVLSAVQS
jgi:drug/metabolite transporter (DMT)-like permease